jgi:hypothetical protein
MEAWGLRCEDALRQGNSKRKVDILHGSISHHLAGDPAYFTFDYELCSSSRQSRVGMLVSVFVNPMRESIDFGVFVGYGPLKYLVFTHD